MPPTTPYSQDLGDREPLDAMRRTLDRFRELLASWSPKEYERSYAPGKWTASQVLTHLAHTELAIGTRARMALTTPRYAAQSFEQDSWMAREGAVSGDDALAAFLAVARLNLAFYASLSASDRATELWHPEYGTLTVDWIVHQMAGHQIHHLKQIEAIAAL